MSFHDTLADFVNDRGVKRTALASACGVKPPSITDWCKGTHRPSADKLPHIAEFLRLTDDERAKLNASYLAVS